MGRVLKPMKVDEFHDYQKRVSIDLMLDRNDKVFFAMVQLEKLEAPDIQGLKRLVQAKINSWVDITWRRVIQLEVHSPSDPWGRGPRIAVKGGSLEFEFSRKEVGVAMNGRTIERAFKEDLEEYEQERREKEPLANTDLCRDDELRQQIPYSEDAWLVLNELVAATEKAREKLAALFNPADGGKLLSAMSGSPLFLLANSVDEPLPKKKAAR